MKGYYSLFPGSKTFGFSASGVNVGFQGSSWSREGSRASHISDRFSSSYPQRKLLVVLEKLLHPGVENKREGPCSYQHAPRMTQLLLTSITFINYFIKISKVKVR